MPDIEAHGAKNQKHQDSKNSEKRNLSQSQELSTDVATGHSEEQKKVSTEVYCSDIIRKNDEKIC